MRRAAAACLVGIVACMAAVTIAFAHAEPARVTPGDGAVLNTPPAQVQIEMSQEMARQNAPDGTQANDIDVFDASGKEVTTVAAAIDNADRKKLTVSLPSNFAVGTYTVKWKTLSADDGDAANGQLSFTYDPSKPANPGKEVVREDILGGSTPEAGSGDSGSAPASVRSGSSDNGVSWITVVAVGLGMLVVGSGGTYLLVQRRR